MKTEIAKKVREIIWCILVFVGVILLCSEPAEQENWGKVFFWSKVEGFGCWGFAALLYKLWETRGLLPDEFLEKDESENNTQL